MNEIFAEKTQAEKLADWLFNIKNAVILTGAGMSTESGLPDFRSNGGLWAGKDPMTIATPKAMEADFDTFVSFYQMRIIENIKHKPHAGHEILARWEEKGYVKRVLTQNVDGYHTAAGSKDVVELHGTLSTVHCNSCGFVMPGHQYLLDDQSYCQVCSGRNRPSIVLFEENLNVKNVSAANKLAKECKLFIVLGTSLKVYPAAGLPDIASRRGAKIVIVDRETFNKGHLTIEGNIRDVLMEVDIILKENYE
jgi:NAD-dependent deacetylase